jgi:hypothetical protein
LTTRISPRPRLPRQRRDLEILVLNLALGGVDHEHADVRALDRSPRPQRRVELDSVVDLALPPQPGGVDEDEIFAMIPHRSVDRVARRTRCVGHHEPILAEQAVHERRLAHVRPADDGDSQRAVDLRRRRRHAADDRVEQIARALPVDRRNGKHFFRAERVELEVVGGPRVVDLVRHHHPRPLRGTQHFGHVIVARMQASLGVDHEQEEIGFGDRLVNLAPDFELHRRARIVGHAAGVDEPVGVPRPLGAREMPVACGPGLVGHDGRVVTHQSIEQRRLTDVRPSDQRNDRNVHAAIPRSDSTSSDVNTSMKSYEGTTGNARLLTQ